MRKEAIVKNRKPLSILVCCSLVLLALLFLQRTNHDESLVMFFLYAPLIWLCVKTMGFSIKGETALLIFKLNILLDWIVSILLMGGVGLFLHIYFHTPFLLTRFALCFVLYSGYALVAVLLTHIALKQKKKSHLGNIIVGCLIISSLIAEYISQSAGSLSASVGLYSFGYYFFAFSLILFLGVVFDRICLLFKNDQNNANWNHGSKADYKSMIKKKFKDTDVTRLRPIPDALTDHKGNNND